MKLEIKQYLRKRKIWIALVSVFLISGLLALELNEQARIENKEVFQREKNIIEQSHQMIGMGQMFDEDGEMINSDLSEFDIILQNRLDELSEAMIQEDWKSMNKCYRDLSLLRAQYILKITEGENFNLYTRDYLNHKEEVIDLINKYDIPAFEADEELGMFDNYGISEVVQTFPSAQFNARYYEDLVQSDIDYLTYSHSDSATIILQFIRSLFPLIPILLAALLFFDSISEDKESGVIKTILTQSGKRTNYLNKKIIGNVITSVLIFIIPFFVFSLVMGVFDQFQTMQAPILTNMQGVTSLGMIENPASDPIAGELNTFVLGLTNFVSLPGNSGSPNAIFDFIPLWQFIGLSLIMAILVIIFCVILNMFLNVIFKNKMVSVFLSIAIVIVGIAITSPHNYSLIYAFLPFTYMNPIHILSGYFTYNYLNGIIVLLGSSAILYWATILIFNKKDIT